MNRQYFSGMKKYAFIFYYIIFGLMGFVKAVEHPHLIVQKKEYQSMRQKANKWPWVVMKEKAIEHANEISFYAGQKYNELCYEIVPKLAGACALAYVLDPEHADIYVDKVETDLRDALHAIRVERENRTNHSSSVGPAHASFMTYIVMDIMYDELDESIRSSMEVDCDYLAENHENSWEASKYSINAMKELYHNGKTEEFERIKDLYKNYILSLTSIDGVYVAGSGYGHSRLYWDERIQKKIFMDICEYQGYHEFYSNPRFVNLYEWFFGYGFTPFNRTITFSDTPPTKTLDSWTVSALRVNRFSSKAQAYASRLIGPLQDQDLIGNILNFVLCDSPSVGPETPSSRIFPVGGAWLLENSNSSRAMLGVLWNNNTLDSSHTHKDANAIHIAAYGEHIMRNSGYVMWKGPDRVTWKWLHSTAQSSNTVLIDGQDHVSYKGGGITEWLLDEDLEYASGSSGNALSNGNHQRNFIFIKPQKNINGYYILLEHVEATSDESFVNVCLHPNSATEPHILADNENYVFDIGGCNYSNHPVSVSLFLATPPKSVDVLDGYKGSYFDCSRYVGKYLYSTYPTDYEGKGSYVSVIYPSDADHPAADMSRIKAADVFGAKIEHSQNTFDCVFEKTQKPTRFENVTFAGEGQFYRTVESKISSFFVKHGTLFKSTNEHSIGFESENKITAFFKNENAQIISPGTELTMFFPEISGVEMDGQAVQIQDRGDYWISFYAPKGKHDLLIVSK